MTNKWLAILPIFFLFSFIATATYHSSEYNSNYAGNFSIDANTSIYSDSNILANGVFVPLVGDLTGNGSDEIIVLDTSFDINVYDADLTLLSTFDVDNVTDSAPLILVDDDGDDDMEIYMWTEDSSIRCGDDGCLWKIDYNGSVWTQELLAAVPMVAGISTCNPSAIGCYGSSPITCVMTQIEEGWPTNSLYYVFGYNGSASNTTGALTDLLEFSDTSGDRQVPCHNSVPTIVADDLEGDGIVDFVFTYFINGENSLEEAHVVTKWAVDATGRAYREDRNYDALTNYLTVDDSACSHSSIKGHLKTSNPIIYDIDNSGNEKEIVYASMVDTNSFKLFSYHASTSSYDDYPENIVLEDCNGDWVGPYVAIADVFPESGRVDFCVNSIYQTDNVEVVLCGSEDVTEPLGYGNYERWETPLLNYAEAALRYPYTGLFSAMHDTGQDRLITSQASYIVDEGEHSDYEDGTIVADRAWYSIYRNSSILVSDAEGDGRADMYGLRAGYIWYIDDRWSNSACSDAGCITEVFFNPCQTAIWKNGTSVEIIVTASDIDGDDVASRVVLYANDSNEQTSGWSINVTGGNPIPHYFVANTTITNGRVLVQARDVNNPLGVETKEFSFSVGLDGVVYGDTSCSYSYEPAEEDVADEVPDIAADETNSLTTFMDVMHGYSGWSNTVLWLLLMLVVGGGIVFAGVKNRYDLRASLMFVSIAEIVMLIIGVIFGYIGIGILITLVVLAFAIAALVFRNRFVGGVQGG